jgi:hypothetical protein
MHLSSYNICNGYWLLIYLVKLSLDPSTGVECVGFNSGISEWGVTFV